METGGYPNGIKVLRWLVFLLWFYDFGIIAAGGDELADILFRGIRLWTRTSARCRIDYLPVAWNRQFGGCLSSSRFLRTHAEGDLRPKKIPAHEELLTRASPAIHSLADRLPFWIRTTSANTRNLLINLNRSNRRTSLTIHCRTNTIINRQRYQTKIPNGKLGILLGNTNLDISRRDLRRRSAR